MPGDDAVELFYTGVHLPGSLVVTRSRARVRVTSPENPEWVFLAKESVLTYVGEDFRSPQGETFIRCLGRTGIVWLHPNDVYVTMAVTAPSDTSSGP